MVRINFIFIVLTFFIISCGVNSNRNAQSYNLVDYNKDFQFFSKIETEELLQLDSLFNSYLNPRKLDIDSVYNDFLNKMISEANENKLFSCDMTTLVDLSKLNIIDYLSKSTFDKIFFKNESMYYNGKDTLHTQYNEFNTNGQWMKLLDSYAKDDTIFIGYVEQRMSTGSFPTFLVFEQYNQYLDFNNQMHRLIVIMHILNQISIWPYNNC